MNMVFDDETMRPAGAKLPVMLLSTGACELEPSNTLRKSWPLLATKLRRDIPATSPSGARTSQAHERLPTRSDALPSENWVPFCVTVVRPLHTYGAKITVAVKPCAVLLAATLLFVIHVTSMSGPEDRISKGRVGNGGANDRDVFFENDGDHHTTGATMSLPSKTASSSHGRTSSSENCSLTTQGKGPFGAVMLQAQFMLLVYGPVASVITVPLVVTVTDSVHEKGTKLIVAAKPPPEVVVESLDHVTNMVLPMWF